MTTEEAVLAELATVHDPEVDRPVTDMGFIREVLVDGDDVVVQMQLPTYFCAPNFTYLMVEDVQAAAERVAGQGHVSVQLEGHYESDVINDGAGSGLAFSEVFGRRQAVEDLDEIRDRFRRKTFLIRQELVCQDLAANGFDSAALVQLSLGDVEQLNPATYQKYRTTREELGIACRPGAPFLVAADGRSVGPDQVRTHRRSASVMAVSFEGNGHLCRSLIQARYPDRFPTEQGDVA